MNTIRCRPYAAARSLPLAGNVRPAGRALTALVFAFCCASLSLTGCSGSSSGSSVASTAQVTTGGISVTARTTKGSSTLSRDTASANGLTVTVESADISTDGVTYQTLVTGPISTTLGQNTNPLLDAQTSLPTGDYEALRVTVSDVSWFADWVTTNPSPCTGATSGHAEGSQALGKNFTLYFATPKLGGNTRAYYRANPPLSGYIGDADHPLIMPAPIGVLKNKTTKLTLVFDTDHLLSCNRINLFATTDKGDTAPQHSVIGEATALFGSYGLFKDTLHGWIGATSGSNNSINFYETGASGDATPTRTIAGPDTTLNGPKGVAFYRGTDTGCTKNNTGCNDEIIVANSGNDTLTTYSSTATGNVAPKRILTGFNRSRLNQPTGLAVYPIPNKPALDEVWVTNIGNDTVTAYNRQNSADADPIYPNPQPTPPLPSIGGAATGLNKPCGIDVADSQGTSQSTTYVFVANAGSDSVTIYDRADVAQSSDGNVAPTFTISGSGSRLSSPCGIRVDASKNEIYVANTGTYGSNFQLSSVTVYTWTADTNGAITNVQLDRTLSSGVNSALTAPTAILLQGGLWVADRGAQPAMTHLPAIYPSPASGQAANAPLTGKYNVILYGVDLSKGINGQGYQIPTLFAERGIANFNPAASPWPAFNLRVDTESRRTVIDRGCVQEDVGGLPKEGFYGVGDDGSFYAFNEGDHGSLRGAYLPDGRAFTGSFYNSSNKLFVIYGIKDTNLSTAYLGTDGTQTGGIAPYAYTVYSNDIIGIHRFESPPQTDLFRYQLLVGAASASHSRFEGVSADGNLNTLTNPMGDFAVPQSSGVIYRTGLTNLGPRPYSPQAGGQFEDQDTTYGMAGAISASGSTMLFMNNISNLDSDSCPAKAGVGVGLRQTASKAFSNNDLKGTFFVAGFGDQFQSLHLPDLYLTEAGTLTFDGTNSVTMSFDMNNQGHALVDQGTLTYQVTTRTMPASQNSAVNATVNVVDLFGSDKSIPFATAIIGEDGKTLAFYRNLVQPNTGPPPTADPVRFLGLALYQHP